MRAKKIKKTNRLGIRLEKSIGNAYLFLRHGSEPVALFYLSAFILDPANYEFLAKD